jgi:orotidine-5'-phosphate decarboxylase
MSYNPIICAIDEVEISKAEHIINETKEYVGFYKFGSEFFTANGPEAIRDWAKSGTKIFLDLKYHDIPKQVSGAVRAAVGLGVKIITVHAAGGLEMLTEAKKVAAEEAKKLAIEEPEIFAITILTSFNDELYNQLGYKGDIKSQVLRFAEIALEAGIAGVVSSPLELEFLKPQFSNKLKFLTPGIRLGSVVNDDQKRTLTPREAIQNGADYIVIGRPITGAADMKKAAKEIYNSIMI